MTEHDWEALCDKRAKEEREAGKAPGRVDKSEAEEGKEERERGANPTRSTGTDDDAWIARRREGPHRDTGRVIMFLFYLHDRWADRRSFETRILGSFGGSGRWRLSQRQPQAS